MAEAIVMLDPSVLKTHPRNDEFFDCIATHISIPLVEDNERWLMEIAMVKGYCVVPIVVTPSLIVIHGLKRLKLAIELGLKEVPVIIKEGATEDDALYTLLMNNLSRVVNNNKVNSIAKAIWVDAIQDIKNGGR